MFGCACPPSTALTAIPANDCGLNIGQIQKLLFQRKQATASPTIPVIADAAELATWTALKALTTNAKVVVSPFCEEVVIPPGTFITEGGDDNTTLNGTQLIVGAGQIPVTGKFRSLAVAVIRALKKLNCEHFAGLTVGFVNQDGDIFGISTGDATTDFRFIPIYSFGVTDAGAEGLNTHDKSNFQFGLKYGWRDRLVKVTPTDFDALVDL
jgi:hypothetical protein